MSFFAVKNLSAGYDGRKVIENVSFEIESGCMVGLLGANASGKTTLLKAICGILRHDGACFLEGMKLESLSPKQIARQCSYIPQRSGISIDISVEDVVLMGFNARMKLLQYPDAGMCEHARKALDTVGLSGMGEMNYLHLSEGQKQLCILARTLVTDARIVLLDEPESALDFRYRYQTLNIIKKWLKDGNRSGIMALHDPILALNYCDKLLLISVGGALEMLNPAVDSLEKMEAQLEKIYGKISLRKCMDRSGHEQIIMLKEQD